MRDQSAILVVALFAAAAAATPAQAQARLDDEIAGARIREAKGGFLPSVSVEGRLHDGTPDTYATGDGLRDLRGSTSE